MTISESGIQTRMGTIKSNEQARSNPISIIDTNQEIKKKKKQVITHKTMKIYMIIPQSRHFQKGDISQIQ